MLRASEDAAQSSEGDKRTEHIEMCAYERENVLRVVVRECDRKWSEIEDWLENVMMVVGEDLWMRLRIYLYQRRFPPDSKVRYDMF